ncbi:MAG: hypothetical protein HOV81_07750 [Kofleriaceae bacterium]|nr:hypothetical protein [Kofleriaceae bacterium]
MRALVVVAVVALASPARASTTTDEWLAGLTERVIDDLRAGKPLVVEVHVPLCDNEFTRCGNAKLGDGDNPSTNLYWSTTPGLGVWFARKGSGWKRVVHLTHDTGDKDVLELHVYRRTVAASAAWRKKGAPKTFEVDLVIHGWRGSAIDRALAAYAADVSGKGTREIEVGESKLAAGGAARIVAFVGHNRLMDLDEYAWPTAGSDEKGTIAIACHTSSYMKRDVAGKTRVPLLMTNDFLFSNAAPLEAAVLTFARGGGYAQIRLDAATAYAGVQKREVKRVFGAFTNPADKRW